MLLPVFHIEHAPWKKIVTQHGTFFKNALSFVLDELVLPAKTFSLGVAFISDDAMREYNTQYRHKNTATNVLSFPAMDEFADLKKMPEPIELGDILIAYETIMREAGAQCKAPRDHVAHMLVHGCFHLFGYDHMKPKDAKEMEALEIRVLDALNIADPYA